MENFEYEGTIYGYSKDEQGVGYWYCVRGSAPGLIGTHNDGLSVPAVLSQKLTAAAIKAGHDPSVFALDKKKDSPKKERKNTAKKRSKTFKLFQ